MNTQLAFPTTERSALGPELPRPCATPDPLDLGSLSDSPELVRLARRYLPSDDLARDAVQDALTELWLRSEPPRNCRGWLVRAVVLRGLHLARTRRRLLRREERVGLGNPEASERDDPTRRVELAELRAGIDAAVARLAPHHRDVFILWAHDELDYAGIADRLGIPIGTVRSRLNRARLALRRELPDVLVG